MAKTRAKVKPLHRKKPSGLAHKPSNGINKAASKRPQKRERAAGQQKSSKHAPQWNEPQEVYIPFIDPRNNILLVGEGDFSFAHSLLKNYHIRPSSDVNSDADSDAKTTHGFAHLHATTFDSIAEAAQKYPQSTSYTTTLLEAGMHVSHSIDATALSKAPKSVRYPPVTSNGERPGWDWIIFNFPHIGGLSTDVRRQVRANQALLVAFFKGANGLLHVPHEEALRKSGDRSRYASEEPVVQRRGKGRLLVTLFEGEPYTMWNVRDLARHTGFDVVRSFRFQAHAFEGYEHARTLGNIVSAEKKGDKGDEIEEEQDDGGTNNGKRPGKWRGEERSARSFVLEVRDDENKVAGKGKQGKRSRGHDEDSE